MFQVGDVLQNRYVIVRPLGSGGFGAVWLAHDQRLGDRPIAIKHFVTAHMRSDEATQSAQLFQSEAHTLANLNHPNLTAVLDYFAVADGWVLVMAYVPGETLAGLQKRLRGPFGQEQVIDWAIQICDVLDYLHRQHPPLVFRDLKPSNIMRTPDGKLMLIDFGIVRTFKEGQQQDTVQLGTPGYAPPEQYGGQTEPRSDLYSLGATLFVLLTNQRLAGGFGMPPFPSDVPPIAPALHRLIERLMALRPPERPQSAAAVRMELERIRANLGTGGAAITAPPGWNGHVQAPGMYQSGPTDATMVNPGLPRSMPLPASTRTPVAPVRANPQRWPLLLLVLLVLLGIGGGAYAFRATLFGNADDGGIPNDGGVSPGENTSQPPLSLIVTSRSDSNSGPYDLYVLPLEDGERSKLVPSHDDNAIADRRRSDERVLFTHGVDQGGTLIEQIFSINADGSAEVQLTSGPGINRAPRWSPDGTRIAFESDRDKSDSNPRDIYIMDADGSNVQRITSDDDWQGGPAWSPDGTQLVFHARRDDRFEIVLLDLDSGQQRTLTSLEQNSFWPDWSPDGATVAFMSEQGTQTAIYTVPVAGGPAREVDGLGAGINRWPRWSPDGRSMAFESQRDGRWQVYVQTIASGDIRRISDGSTNDRWPAW